MKTFAKKTKQRKEREKNVDFKKEVPAVGRKNR